MKIVVCVKYFQGEINPFDECALECALSAENADITVLSMGPMSAAEPMKRLTRLDVNRTILLSDSSFAGADTLATSYALSCAIKKINPDLVLCGRQSVDGDTAQVGPGLSSMLGYNLITNVMEFGTETCVTRFGEEKVTLPAVMTVERINTLRFPSIRSKAKDIEILTASDIGADISRCGLRGSPTRVMKTFESVRGKRSCKFIDKSELDSLIKRLISEQSQQKESVRSDVRFDSVWAIGTEVREKALEIADNVIVIDEKDPVKIAEMAEREKPDVILWNADLYGRKNAPITASILRTGLCADCTALETDGENLFMYRPARSGNITAKIKCLTKPQMATVRTSRKSDSIIFSGGRGVADKLDILRELCRKYNGELCVSRPVVDMNKAPYDMQVGLTGKNVSPKIYVAAGISGAVQHTCAIENADTVIAVNPDKNARIFDFADYGIISSLEEL